MSEREPSEFIKGLEEAATMGPWMYDLLERLFPICRSLTG